MSALGGLGATLAALLTHASLETTALQPLAAVIVFAAIMTVAIGAIDGHHPFERFGLGNTLTMVRGIVVAVAASLIAEPIDAAVAWTAVGLTAAAAALDGLDGWAARRSGMVSPFGARFDMETDALLILVLSALVWRHDKAGVWVLGSGLMRYAFVAAGWVLPWLSAPLRSTIRGKAAAVGQLVGLGLALAPVVTVPFSSLAAASALVVLTWSFAIDVRFLWRTRTTGT